ncbi:AroM family protein [Gemmatimonadota bacterium]
MSVVLIGAVTIGQSPRDDVVPELLSRLGSGVEIVQRGALDDLSLDFVRAHGPVTSESFLVSRMRDGTEVQVDKGFMVPRLQAAIRAIEEKVRLILVLCSASFDDLDSKVPLLHPAYALDQIVTRSRVHRLGVLTPALEQVPAQRVRWQGAAEVEAAIVAASPYEDPRALEDAATELAHNEVDFVVLDCIGYTEAMREQIERSLIVPVVSAVGALENTTVEMLDRGIS